MQDEVLELQGWRKNCLDNADFILQRPEINLRSESLKGALETTEVLVSTISSSKATSKCKR